MNQEWTESAIQALKAQEAKDLAIEFLQQLQAKDRAPITAGQVQLKELQYSLRLKEAEAEDNRVRQQHEIQIKKLELEIEQEKSRQATAVHRADQLRAEHAQLIERVRESQESLSIQLERATRENQVKLEALESDFSTRQAKLDQELTQLEQRRGELLDTIRQLTQLNEIASDVAELHREIESRKANQLRQLAQLDESFDEAQFQKQKRVSQVKREQEIELADLEAALRQQVTGRQLDAARKILEQNEMLAVDQTEWNQIQARLSQERLQDESAMSEIRRQAVEEIKRSYNITTPDVFDVTELYYRERSLAAESQSLRQRLDKLESEISRMQQHIELEPERMAKAVQAAKVQVENRIEPARNR